MSKASENSPMIQGRDALRPIHWPRPYAMHWGMAAMGVMQGQMMVHMMQSGIIQPEQLPFWEQMDDGLKQGLCRSLETNDHDPAILAKAASDKMIRFHEQVQRYRHYPIQRDGSHVSCVFQYGGVRLLKLVDSANADETAPLLVIPSLINRYHIMDLNKDDGFFQYLKAQGRCVYVVDWGELTADEVEFGLADYIQILTKAVAYMSKGGRSIDILGYCMGGVMAVGLMHCLKQEFPLLYADIRRLVLLATPWDFHAVRRDFAQFIGLWSDQFFHLDYPGPQLDPDMQHCLFMALDPLVVLKKYEQFAAMEDGSEAAAKFVLVEDWVNDGVSVSRKVARECLGDWYGRNHPALGRWILSRQGVDPSKIDKPTLLVSASRDRLIPYAMSQPLFEKMPEIKECRVETGHVGLMVGRQAKQQCWQPIAAFLT